ncbi:hypothetical protein ACIBHX_10465 [Nonomuraea sp. NPDC050536]|uniref:hypothetical protein n=1 Tax=Nonomuraea sp. NPDC050536 TaxID=3364366 RepID=UPI0037C5AFE2
MTVTYTVTYERGRWKGRTPGVLGSVGASTLRGLHAEARDSAAFIWEGEEVDITFVYDLPEDMAPSLATYWREVELAAEHDRLRLEAARSLARELTSAGLSERDAAAIMGITGPRVHQLKVGT